MNRQPLTDDDGEVRELEAEDFAAMRPAEKVLPPELLAVLPRRKPGQRGPGRSIARRLVSLRIKPDVIERYRAGGPGWQTRMTAAIEAAVADECFYARGGAT